jgi:hypothetical protein
MKLLDIDWIEFIEEAKRWKDLSLSAKETYIKQAKYPDPLLPKDFGDDFDDLWEHEFLARLTDNIRVKVPDRLRVFVRTLRMFASNPVFIYPDLNTLDNYLKMNLTREEREDLSGDRYSWSDVHEKVSSIVWLERFLECKTMDDLPPAFYGIKQHLQTPILFDHAKKFMRKLMEEKDLVLFIDLPAKFPELNGTSLNSILLACFNCCLIFPGFRKEDLQPAIGIWPGITKRLHKIKAPPPKPVQVSQPFSSVWWMEDLTQMLLAAVVEPLRVRQSDDEFTVPVEDKLWSQMITLPDWLLQIFDHHIPLRIMEAKDLGISMGLLENHWMKDGKQFLEITSTGLKWIEQSEKDRWKSILECIQKSREDDAKNSDGSSLWFLFFPCVYYSSYDRKRTRDIFDQAVCSAYLSVPKDVFIRMSDFTVYQAENDKSNPLFKLAKNRIHRSYSFQNTPEGMETSWRDSLLRFFFERLMPLGCVKLGIIDGTENEIGFTLTSAGRFFLGDTNDFDCGVETDGKVIVQPNFEVMFLSPSPLAEARLSRFAQRVGKNIGVLFKITKASIQKAAMQGIALPELFETLKDVTSKPVPQNVELEIRSWHGSIRQVSIKPAYLIECPDEETASKVLAIHGKVFPIQSITPTVLAMSNVKSKTALIRKLRDKGIVIQ